MFRACVYPIGSMLLLVGCNGDGSTRDPWAPTVGGGDAVGGDEAQSSDTGVADEADAAADDDTADGAADDGHDDGDDAPPDGPTGDGDDDDAPADDGPTGDGPADDGTADDGGTACTDAMEPNDSATEAAGIDPEVDYDATICAGDVDYYSFSAPAAGTWAMLAASFDAAAGDIDMMLYEANGTTLVASSTAGDPVEHIEAWDIDAGTYVVAIEHAGGEDVAYVLNFQLHE